MKNFLADLIKRLTSRKFLLTVASGLVLIANQQWQELTLLVGGYLGVEGFADVVGRYSTGKQTTAAEIMKELEEDDVDTTRIVAGNIPM